MFILFTVNNTTDLRDWASARQKKFSCPGLKGINSCTPRHIPINDSKYELDKNQELEFVAFKFCNFHLFYHFHCDKL